MRRAIAQWAYPVGAVAIYLTLLAGFVSAAPTSYAQNSNVRQTQSAICESLKHCQELLMRYGPDSFDYSVLASEFRRYGPSAQNWLVFTTAQDDAEKSRAALEVILRQSEPLAAREQAVIISGWPKNNLDLRTRLMWKMGGPKVQSALISTLGHDNSTIRLSARHILDRLADEDRLTPPSLDEFAAIKDGLAEQPSAGLAELMGYFAPPQSGLPLIEALKSGDAPTVISAYAQLYAQDKQSAFETLINMLYKLEYNDMAQALSLSELLRTRHNDREDGFYLAFAREILADSKMSEMGRFVGFDAILAYDGARPAPVLPPSIYVSSAARMATRRGSLPPAYGRSLARQSEADQIQIWPIFWAARTPENQRYDLIRYVPPALTQKLGALWSEALDFTPDFRVQIEAIKRLKMLDDPGLKARLTNMAQTHPIAAVRLAIVDGVPAKAAVCPVRPLDLDDVTKGMPYFESGSLIDTQSQIPAFTDSEPLTPALRYYLKSAQPLKNGWLAGYVMKSGAGGLIYYDTKTQKAQRLMDAAVYAALPTKPHRAGYYENEAWVISVDKNEHKTGVAALSRVMASGGAVSTKFVRMLPGVPDVIGQDADGSLRFAYKGIAQAPVRILPDGSLTAGCP